MKERTDNKTHVGADNGSLESWFSSEVEKRRETPEYRLEEVLYDLTEQIVEVMKECGVSKAELARRLGRDRSFVTRMLDGRHNTTFQTAVRTACALGKTVYVQIADPGMECVVRPRLTANGRHLNPNGDPIQSLDHPVESDIVPKSV